MFSRAFSELADKSAEVGKVEVSSARSLSAEERNEISQGVARRLQGSTEYSWTVDETLIGGIILAFDGKIIDGSVRGRMTRIREQLLRG